MGACHHSEEGEGTTNLISAIPQDIIQTHILPKLEGHMLATAGCASRQLRSLSSEERLWRDLSRRAWPSTGHALVQQLISTFPYGHRSFYADSFPALVHHHRPPTSLRGPPAPAPAPTLVSAVDIYYGDKLVFSKVEEMETESKYFLHSEFLVTLLGPKQRVAIPVKFENWEGVVESSLEDYLTVSWILIDPTRKRSGSVSSSKPVSVQRHWLTGEVELRYATVLAGERKGDLLQCAVVVTCGGGEGGNWDVREVSLKVEDMVGRMLRGKESLVILQDALERGERRGGGKNREEIDGYDKFLAMQKKRRERRQRKDGFLELAVISVFVTIAMTIFIFLLQFYIWRLINV